MSKLDDLIRTMCSEFGGDLIQISVAGNDGMSIASQSSIRDIDLAETMTARVVMAQQAAAKVTGKMGFGDLEVAITTTSKAYIITKFIGDGSYGIYGSFTKNAILGNVRTVIEDYAPKIWDAIPK